jgi:hypothetical protein
MIFIRNILFISLAIALTDSVKPVLIHHDLLKLLNALKTRLSLKKSADKERGKFWEIDMTKFEP